MTPPEINLSRNVFVAEALGKVELDSSLCNAVCHKMKRCDARSFQRVSHGAQLVPQKNCDRCNTEILLVL